MALLVPNVGEVVLLTDLLNGANTREAWTLKLFKTNVTPAETDTAGSYTVADFTGYSDKTLTRTTGGSTWATPTTSSGTTSSQYNAGTPQSWSATSAQTVYGYYFVGATSAVLILAENFGAIALVNPSTLTLIPYIALD